LPVPSPHSHFLDLATLHPQILAPKGRLIVVGDIHGSIKPLESLLTKLKYHPKVDTLLHVGDTVAKGPDPLEVLALLRLYKVMG
jgi:predicted phosphodiesterase